MTQTFRYRLFDRKDGKEFGRPGGETINAENKTEARKLLAEIASRDIPRGRYGARNFGYVPFRDWRIVWIEP